MENSRRKERSNGQNVKELKRKEKDLMLTEKE